MEHQHLEDDYLYEDEDALSQLRELRSKIDYARKNGEIERALFLYDDPVRIMDFLYVFFIIICCCDISIISEYS